MKARVLGLLIVSVACGYAGVIASADGTASPGTQGWTDRGGILSGASVSDLGESSWQMTGDSCCGYWFHNLTAQEWTDAFARGWSFSGLIRSTSTQGFGYLVLDTNSPLPRFDLTFGFDGVNGWAGLSAFTDAANPARKTTFSNSVYHLIDMRYDATTQTASLWVDGALALSGYSGHTTSREGHGPFFGVSGSGPELFSQVTFAINDAPVGVPEPATFGIAAAGLGVIWAAIRRLRP